VGAAVIACVLCIHSFASSWRQYRGLVTRLAPRFRVLAVDLYGHGEREPWEGGRDFTLADEAAPLEASLPASGPLHLVGHSYGAAVALRIAANHRPRVRSMVLYEPAIWGTLAALCPGEPATREIEAVRDDTVGLLERGAEEAAAERFIDYWTGPGAWAATPQERRPKLIATVRTLRDGWQATFLDRWSADALRALDIPCLLLSGTSSTAAARRAVRLLGGLLPRALVTQLDGLAHMGPVTRPEQVDPLIESFITGGYAQASKAA
jgi:pimeloyl-ACP methyl ester carboxylesterase